MFLCTQERQQASSLGLWRKYGFAEVRERALAAYILWRTRRRAFTAYILWSSGFARMELLRLTDVQSGPGQTRMSHWRCDILKQVALKSPSVWDGLFTRSSLSVSPSNSRCSQIFTPPGCMPLRLWLPLTLQMKKSRGCGKSFSAARISR
jgi:hypothetical protein